MRVWSGPSLGNRNKEKDGLITTHTLPTLSLPLSTPLLSPPLLPLPPPPSLPASTTDWVAVPKNTALAVIREKDGFINIMRSPLWSGIGAAPQDVEHAQMEVRLNIPKPQRWRCVYVCVWERGKQGLGARLFMLLSCTHMHTHTHTHTHTHSHTCTQVSLRLEAVGRGISAKSRELWQSIKVGSLSFTGEERSIPLLPRCVLEGGEVVGGESCGNRSRLAALASLARRGAFPCCRGEGVGVCLCVCVGGVHNGRRMDAWMGGWLPPPLPFL
jgi:hypothetical protein